MGARGRSAARSSDIGFGLLTLSRSTANFSFFTADLSGPELTDQFFINK